MNTQHQSVFRKCDWNSVDWSQLVDVRGTKGFLWISRTTNGRFCSIWREGFLQNKETLLVNSRRKWRQFSFFSSLVYIYKLQTAIYRVFQNQEGIYYDTVGITVRSLREGVSSKISPSKSFFDCNHFILRYFILFFPF